MKILIIKLGAIGDVLRTTSFLKGLKDKYEGCNIDWVTRKNAYELLKGNELINNTFLIDEDKPKKEYELVISLDDEDEACRLASETKTEKLVGAYIKEGKKTYTEDSKKWFDMGLTSRFGKEKADELKRLNKETYQKIIADILGIKVNKPTLNLREDHRRFAKEFAKKNNIQKGDNVIGINTGAGKRWPQKRLSINQTVDIIDKLYDEETKIILFGGPEEKDRNKKIIETSKSKIINAGCDNTLMQFASLINLCNTIIVSDSLALHIAVALNKSVIAFFGPTSAAEIELYGRGQKILPNMDCLCCYKKSCHVKPNCMETIDIEEIIRAVKI